MLRKLNAFHRNIKGGWIFVPGIHPPPLKHLNCFGLPLSPRWRTIKLEAKCAVNIQHTICTNNLEDIEKRYVKINKSTEWNKVFLSVWPCHHQHYLKERPRNLFEPSLMLINIKVCSRLFHRDEVQDLLKTFKAVFNSIKDYGQTIHLRFSYLKEEQNFGAMITLFNKITKAFIEDDLFSPLRNDRFILLKIKWLSHDGKNVINIFILVKWRNWALAIERQKKQQLKLWTRNTPT